MKGIIFYYSGSGNTKLACQYISKNLTNIELELFDMVKAKEIPNLEPYDIVGFAAFTKETYEKTRYGAKYELVISNSIKPGL